MGKISILAIFTIFAIHNIEGIYDWETVSTDYNDNSLFFSLAFLLIDESQLPKKTDYVVYIRKQLAKELGDNWNEYGTDARLQGATFEQLKTALEEEEGFQESIYHVLLELVSKLYRTEIVVCDWTLRNIRVYRKGDDIVQRSYLLYPAPNHYDPLYKGRGDFETKRFMLGNERDNTRYDDVLALARDTQFFQRSAAEGSGGGE